MPEPQEKITEKKEKLSPRKIRQKALAAAVMEPGATYEAVGEKLYPNAAYPRQTVYSALQQPTAQAEIARISADVYDENELKQTVTQILRTGKEPNRLKAAELGMRSLAMLTDKQIQDQRIIEKRADLSDLSIEQMAEEMQRRLKLSASGVIASESREEAPGEANADKPLSHDNKAENQGNV